MQSRSTAQAASADAWPDPLPPAADRIAAFLAAETAALRPESCPELVLRTAPSMAGIWERAQESLGRIAYRPPYWALPWVGGQALARYLLDRPATVAGRDVLDLGAGGGICAIAAARCGARVRACEIDPIARVALALNAALNGVEIAPAPDDLLERAPPRVDVILAADLWYERPLAEAATGWLRRAACAGSTVLLGDRGRAFFPREGVVPLAAYPIVSSPEVEQDARTVAGVWRIAP